MKELICTRFRGMHTERLKCVTVVCCVEVCQVSQWVPRVSENNACARDEKLTRTWPSSKNCTNFDCQARSAPTAVPPHSPTQTHKLIRCITYPHRLDHASTMLLGKSGESKKLSSPAFFALDVRNDGP